MSTRRWSRKGWGSDRRVARQVRTLQAASGDGVSLYLRPDPGNCSELALVGRLAAAPVGGSPSRGC